jgi:eukaryotic-like serine/threonine-protein kinase
LSIEVDPFDMLPAGRCGIVDRVGERRVLEGRYQLEDVLGSGGTSEVWRAADLVLNRSVAVKLLSGAFADDDRFRVAIRTEAQTAARVSHPHLASVYDYGESIDDAGNPVPYVVMELLTGPTLTQRLADRPLPPRSALRICAEIAAGLATAHAHGLVHRDVKPGNIVLTGTGAKLVDFGVATIAGSPEAGSNGDVMGTPSYVAPERLLAGTALPASDVYSLGAVLFRSLTGKLPWPAGSASLFTRTAAPLPHLEGVPVQVAELYLRCVDTDPDRRPTAREVATILAASSGIRPVSSSNVEEPDERAAAPLVAVAASVPSADMADTAAPGTRRRRAAPIFMAVTAAAVAGILAAGSLNGPPRAGNPPSVPTVAGPDASHPTSNPPVVNPGASNGPLPGGPTVTEWWPPGVPSAGPGVTGGPIPSIPPVAGTSAPPPTTVEPATRTFTSPGGNATATCTSSLAYIESWTPTSGYSVPQPPHRGPDTTVWITFRKQNSDATITIWCTNGQPVGEVSTVHTTRTPQGSKPPSPPRTRANLALPADRRESSEMPAGQAPSHLTSQHAV